MHSVQIVVYNVNCTDNGVTVLSEELVVLSPPCTDMVMILCYILNIQLYNVL